MSRRPNPVAARCSLFALWPRWPSAGVSRWHLDRAPVPVLRKAEHDAMKNKLITLAGALALAAVLGKFYAVPAFAQVRAALMQDRDSKARNYYQTYNLNCGYALNICSADLPVVPAGKRLVIEHI